eukprot:TRINITY_DN25894_c0_g1_i1.p1 TRINITY_DN25894_c0_g1~~TRINITY_DN25894_c0_g1_i1.p1  ORF type:complete len:664 (-),score=212.25 TRINITY_DN25894_c0_g1_i1:19-2010(-)
MEAVPSYSHQVLNSIFSKDARTEVMTPKQLEVLISWTSNPENQDAELLEAIGDLARVDENRVLLANSILGNITSKLKTVDSWSQKWVQYSIRVIGNLTFRNDENVALVISSGVVPLIVQAIQTPVKGSDWNLQKFTSGVIANLAVQDEEVKTRLVQDHKAHLPLIALLTPSDQSPDGMTLMMLMRAVRNLMDEEQNATIIVPDLLPLIIKLIKHYWPTAESADEDLELFQTEIFETLETIQNFKNLPSTNTFLTQIVESGLIDFLLQTHFKSNYQFLSDSSQQLRFLQLFADTTQKAAASESTPILERLFQLFFFQSPFVSYFSSLYFPKNSDIPDDLSDSTKKNLVDNFNAILLHCLVIIATLDYSQTQSTVLIQKFPQILSKFNEFLKLPFTETRAVNYMSSSIRNIGISRDTRAVLGQRVTEGLVKQLKTSNANVKFTVINALKNLVQPKSGGGYLSKAAKAEEEAWEGENRVAVLRAGGVDLLISIKDDIVIDLSDVNKPKTEGQVEEKKEEKKEDKRVQYEAGRVLVFVLDEEEVSRKVRNGETEKGRDDALGLIKLLLESEWEILHEEGIRAVSNLLVEWNGELTEVVKEIVKEVVRLIKLGEKRVKEDGVVMLRGMLKGKGGGELKNYLKEVGVEEALMREIEVESEEKEEKEEKK